MIITKTVIISRSGDLRIARANPKAGKDEVIGTLHVEVEDAVFEPARLTLRATVVRSTVTTTERLIPPKADVRQLPAEAPKLRAAAQKPLVKDDGRPCKGRPTRKP